MNPSVGRVGQLYAHFENLLRELAKFGTVGAFAAVIDIGIFNWLRFGPLDHKVLTAKAVSTTVAATFAYFANRHWTWRYRDRKGLAREYSLFFLFNAIGLLIAEACLGFSHYVLGLDHPLADNISANVIGLGLGTIFRFWSYRRWVFPEPAEPAAPAGSGEPAGSADPAPAGRG